MLSRLIGTMDRVFVVIFARYRRKLGDAEIDAAWRIASNRVTSFIVLPIAALVVVTTLLLYWFEGIQSSISQHDKSLTQVVAVLVGLVLIIFLEKRFKKYLLSPPVLAVKESIEDGMLVVKFRIISVGIFLGVCLLGYFWHSSHVGT